MRFDRIQQFVAKVRKWARKQGCNKCHKFKEVGLNGTPSLSHLARQGDLAKIKTAIRERGWFCRACVRRKQGTTAAATLRDQYNMGDPAQEKAYFTRVWEMEGCLTDAPNGYRRITWPGTSPDCFEDLKAGV
ncbi:MAG: hypothetical protein KAJ19_13580 [Gammaproteobacteria bacterium]|nr:hypothetical protein [Gammaproteobacteria bacterium]